jgi:hypothetical protein
MTQNKVMRALEENKSKGKPFLPFRELVERVNEGALKHQGKIGSEVYSNREFFYLVENKGK